MKKIILFLTLSVFTVNILPAKTVKFAVDMGSYTISPAGIHVMGDFQVAAGYSLNFDPGSTLMNQAGATTIYTVIVNIPAFQKYEFKFINGNQGYEAEFVPNQARVGYNLNDNRWLYVDSLKNDTTYLGAIRFNENSPAGKTLVRFLVDMQGATPIPTTGVHLGSTYQGEDPATTRLYNFEGSIYEVIGYMNTGSQSYKFYNGNTTNSSETVPAGCGTNGKRTHNVTQDTILPAVCFSSCVACPVGLKENKVEYSTLKIFPNPCTDIMVISNLNQAIGKIIVVDITGKKCMETEQAVLENKMVIDISHLNSGTYQVYLKEGEKYRHARIIKN